MTMTINEQCMFALEQILPEIESHKVRQRVRWVIQKLSSADAVLSDAYEELNEIREKYSYFDQFIHLIPGMPNYEDYDYEEDDEE